MNFVFIAGHLGKDPETRFTADGTKVTTLVVATHSKKGAKEDTIWWRVTVWGDRFDKMVTYLTKGKPIMVKGELYKPETYVDKNGAVQIGSLEVRADSIHFSPFGKPDQNGQPTNQSYSSTPQNQDAAPVSAGTKSNVSHDFESEDDQLPF
jgi:single-strand DNA-binding protein